MKVAVPAAALAERTGGQGATFELVNALARRGHEVEIVHFRVGHDSADYAVVSRPATSIEELTWIEFDERVTHHFPEVEVGHPFPCDMLPTGDVIFEHPFNAGRDHGLPVLHAHGLFGTMATDLYYCIPCPKLCVSRWVVDQIEELGEPRNRLVYVPNGIDHHSFRVIEPVDARRHVVCMRWGHGDVKGTEVGIEALHAVKATVPDLEVILFDTAPAPAGLPDWCSYREFPSRATLSQEIFNASAVVLVPSVREGFGLVGLEAMASGCALVTTNNGGSREYAVDGQTAVVVGPNDPDAIARAVTSLLQDPARRVELATRGTATAQGFTWERSAELCEQFLLRYIASPEDYGWR